MPDSHIPPEERPNQTPAPEQTPVPDAEQKQSEEKKPWSLAADLYGWQQALTFALLILIVVFTFCGRIIGVDGYSMEPTLDNGDMLLLQCVGYELEQGDVVVLHKDFGDIKTPIVKRVIAVGGQTVEIDYSTSTVYVDGQAIDEPYINEPVARPDSVYMQNTYWEVPEGSIFVMGDNRNHSSDSRDDRLGVVDTRYVLGRALLVVLPFQHIGVIR